MENFFVLTFIIQKAMDSKKYKLPTNSVFSFLTCIVFLVITGCKGNRDETWRCFDTSGNTVGGVVIVSHFGLAGGDESAVNARFSDIFGKVILDFDADTPWGLRRGHVCIYSRQSRNGDAGLGERWHAGQPIPLGPVYFDEWENKIYLAPGGEDPQTWHSALSILVSSYSYRSFLSGGKKLGMELHPFILREQREFLQKYGEQLVPVKYLNSPQFQRYYGEINSLPAKNLKFKDITPCISKP